MKKFMIAGFIVAVCLLVIPLLSGKNKKSAAVPAAATVKTVKEKLPAAEKTTFRIKVGDKVETLSAEEYLLGVVSAEMPASFEAEALKAQTVAACSFALYRKQKNKDNEYDLTDSYKPTRVICPLPRLKKNGAKRTKKTQKRLKTPFRR